MAAENTRRYAFNRTRQAFLATRLQVADRHWTRLCGLMGRPPGAFVVGQGLWIKPCHGVHTFALRFAIDVIYLDAQHRVVHVEENVKPWRLTPVLTEAATVLELPSRTVWHSGTQVGDELEIVLDCGRGAAA
jgi:uncharacterized protein